MKFTENQSTEDMKRSIKETTWLTERGIETCRISTL